MKERVVITGIGVICGNAGNRDEFAEACFFGKSGIRKCSVFPTEGLLTPYFGEVEGLDSPDRFGSLLKISAEEMMADAQVNAEYLASLGKSCRMFLGSLLYSADTYYKHSSAKKNEEDEDFLAHMNEYSDLAKQITGVRGMVYASSAACASGTTAAGMAFDYIRNGLCDCAVVGGIDSLSIIAAYGFHALKALSNGICNPYDEERDGINIGECGTFFFLETLEHAIERKARIYCEVAGYALGNDGYHITSPEPNGTGACKTMQEALDDGGISPRDLNYINGHGTGTRINDDMELKAVEKLFSDSAKSVNVSSTKALIGHCMGASGAVELASVILSMANRKYLPMPKLRNPMTVSEKAVLSAETFELEIRYALSNSFAFGGNSASVLVRNYPGGECK